MEKKIEDLTPEQDLKLDVYAEKYTKLGLSMEPIVHEQAEEAFRKSYEKQGLARPQTIEWHPSPFAMVVRAAILETIQELTEQGKKYEEAEKEAAELFDRTKPFSDAAQTKLRSLLDACCYGQHDANWLGWGEFFRKEVGLTEETEDIAALIDTVETAHWWLPFENLCLASERPLEMHLGEANSDGVRNLHKDGGPALRYSDGFCLYVLNDVSVPDWLVMQKPEALDPNEIMKLENAEQRKEGIKKIGIDRMREALKVQVIDSWKDYELWTIEFEGRRIGPYLKMVNDSTGQIHVEGVGEATGGVDPKIKTCKEALAWRGNFEEYTDPIWSA